MFCYCFVAAHTDFLHFEDLLTQDVQNQCFEGIQCGIFTRMQQKIKIKRMRGLFFNYIPTVS